GGCLCGAIRYETRGKPLYSGVCYCGDCRKSSGSVFVPVSGYALTAFHLTKGEPRTYTTPSTYGKPVVLSFCGDCGSKIFGGIYGVDETHTVNVGTLDDLKGYEPRTALFVKDRPEWAVLKHALTEFQTMPGA
ncbi:glutathione-dependent formaldehyde-activating protein GFA, partial [Trichodelitschia bisporula]